MGIIAATSRELAAHGDWRIRVIGERHRLPQAIVDALDSAQQSTSALPGMVVNLAVCYGGREEIVEAARAAISARLRAGAGIPGEISSEDISRNLSSGAIEPELVIRTSGELRSSGFLMWSGVDAELAFCKSHWPDFSRRDFNRAIRRFGRKRLKRV